MYKVNGIDLSTTEYETIRMLVEAGPDKDSVSRAAQDDLAVEPAFLFRDHQKSLVYFALRDHGLIECEEQYGMAFSVALTLQGVDFVRDYDRLMRDERRARWMRLGHDLFIASVGFVSAVVVWALTKFC